jgi:hypothetical protein
MSIKTSNEFLLFMDMRAGLGWVSYNMTSRRWVLATANYNLRLDSEALNSAKNIVTIPKHPRALTEHLVGAIEMKIASRIARNDFTCMAFTILHRLRDIVKDAAASGEQKMVSDPAFSKFRT